MARGLVYRSFGTILAAILLAFTLAGCTENPDDNTPDGGSDTGTEDTTVPTEISCTVEKPKKVSGTLQIHPVTSKIDSGHGLKGTKISLYPALEVVGGKLEPLLRKTGSMTCARAVTSFDASKSKTSWSIDKVDLKRVQTGLIALAEGTGSKADTFVPTGVGINAQNAESGKKMPVTIVSSATIQKLAEISGKSKTDFLEKGVILGRVLDGDGNPVSGYRIGRDSEGGIDVFDKALYPNSDYSNATKAANGGETSSNGVFMITDKALTQTAATESGDTVDTTTVAAGTLANTVYTMVLKVK